MFKASQDGQLRALNQLHLLLLFGCRIVESQTNGKPDGMLYLTMNITQQTYSPPLINSL